MHSFAKGSGYSIITKEHGKQTCSKIPKRSAVLDPQDPISGILLGLGSYTVLLGREPLKIMNPAT